MITLILAAALQASVLVPEPQDFTKAYKQSLKSGRPLVVMLGADWCPACQVMKKSTLPEVAKAGGLKDVEFTYVDVDLQPKLAAILMRGNSIPQLIRFDKTSKGWRARYLIGAQGPKEVTSFVEVPRRAPVARLTSSQAPKPDQRKP